MKLFCVKLKYITKSLHVLGKATQFMASSDISVAENVSKRSTLLSETCIYEKRFAKTPSSTSW